MGKFVGKLARAPFLVFGHKHYIIKRDAHLCSNTAFY